MPYFPPPPAPTAPAGSSGQVQFNSAGAFGGAAQVVYAAAGPHVTVTASASGIIPVVVQAAASQTANLTEWRTSAGSSYIRVTPTALEIQTDNDPSFVVRNAAGSSRFMATATGFNTCFNLGITENLDFTKTTGTIIRHTGGGGVRLDSNAFCVYLGNAATPGWGVRGASGQTAPLYVGQLLSSTSTAREAFDLLAAWADSTDATRKARVTLRAWDTAARECLRAEATGTAPAIGFLGAAAVARPTATGSRAGNAALASLLTALANLGLITDSTTA